MDGGIGPLLAAFKRPKNAVIKYDTIGIHYETYFITSGTIASEKDAKLTVPLLAGQNSWHEEQISRAKEKYDSVKLRYENPKDEVYQNQWFKCKHLDPAWQGYSKSLEEYNKFDIKRLGEVSQFDHTGWLKIFFRMGLVVLFMLLAHRLTSVFHFDTDPK